MKTYNIGVCEHTEKVWLGFKNATFFLYVNTAKKYIDRTYSVLVKKLERNSADVVTSEWEEPPCPPASLIP